MKGVVRTKTWKKKNKTMAILEHLKTYGSINTWTAIKEYGATRLSAIIFNLRHNYNLDIESKEVEFKDRYGNNSSYAEYILKGGDINE